MVTQAGMKRYLEAIVIAGVFFAIALAFFVLLDSVTSAQGSDDHSFGAGSIIAALVIGIVAGLFLVWLKGFMDARPYVGLVIGLIVIAAVEYSFKYRFAGPYTMTFQVIIGVLTAGYVLFYFIKYRNNTTKNTGQTFDDS